MNKLLLIICLSLPLSSQAESPQTLDEKLGMTIPYSKERVALRTLYHMNSDYINKEIIEGLQEGDRGKVYNEIKYGLGFPDIAEIFGQED